MDPRPALNSFRRRFRCHPRYDPDPIPGARTAIYRSVFAMENDVGILHQRRGYVERRLGRRATLLVDPGCSGGCAPGAGEMIFGYV